MARPTKYSYARERFEQLAEEHTAEHRSQSMAIATIAAKVSCTTENAGAVGTTARAGCRPARRLTSD